MILIDIGVVLMGVGVFGLIATFLVWRSLRG